MARHILDEVLLLAGSPAENLPELARLDEILVGDGDLLGDSGAGPLLVFLARLDGLVGEIAVGGGIVGVGAVVAVDGHDAVALVGVEGAQGCIDGNLLVVDAESVAVGVRVGEESGLQDWVGGGLDARDHVGGGKGHLLDFGKVIFGIAVEGEAAERAEGYFALGPDLREVEDVPAEFLGVARREDLYVAGPGGVVALLDRVEKVLGMPVGILGSHFRGFFVVEGFAALVGLAVDLNIVEGAIRLGKFVGMAGVAIHITIRVRRTTV